MEMLANEWNAEELADWGLDLPEFSVDDSEAEEDDYVMPDEITTDIVPGDFFEIGEHRLLCGDSTKTETFAKLFDGNFADMVLTDPPYNVDYEGKTKDALKIDNDKMDNDSFRQFLNDAFVAADNVLKKGGVFYIWHADFEAYNLMGACFDVGWKVRQCLMWVKNNIVMGRKDYQYKHEPCLYGWKE